MTVQALEGLDVRGAVIPTGHPDYDVARRSWNLSVDQRPAAVVQVADADDVAAAVRFAAQAGLRVAPQSTGHGSEPLGDLAGAILLRTSALKELSVDPATSTLRVGAGVTAGEAADAAGAHGLAPVLGLAASVGVTGLVLGGGYGWLSRSHGLAAEQARAFEVVDARGEQHRVDSAHDPDLFWALRGGGATGVIVTAVELAAHPIESISAGMLAWDVEHAVDVLEQFRALTRQVPESVSVVFRHLAIPGGPRLVAILLSSIGTEADGERWVAPLRAGRPTLMDSFGPVAPAQLPRVAGDPEDPVPSRGDGVLLDDLNPDFVQRIGGQIAAGELAPLSVFEVRHLGGALSRVPEGAGALGRLDGAYSVFAAGPAHEPTATGATLERLGQLRADVAPWTATQAMLSSAVANVPRRAGFSAAAWKRLVAIRDARDPQRRILSAREA